MPTWILDRLFTDKRVPGFAFNSTVNWMRALALLVDDDKFTDIELKKHFSKVIRRTPNTSADTIVLQNTLMAFHNLASLSSIEQGIAHKYDSVRLAIVAWYYCIYFTSSAMIAAASGGSSETHTGTAKIWHSDFVQSNLLLIPFSLHLDNLVKNDIQTKISLLRGSSSFNVNTAMPKSKDEAWGAVVSYLSGSAEYEAEKVSKRVRSSNDFKALGVSNFRTIDARKLRDEALRKARVNFLNQSFRYRGKANYRDSVFLSYGANHLDRVEQLTSDLVVVAEKYLRMAVHYLELRVDRGVWSDFTHDLENNSRMSYSVDLLKL